MIPKQAVMRTCSFMYCILFLPPKNTRFTTVCKNHLAQKKAKNTADRKKTMTALVSITKWVVTISVINR